MYFCHISPPPIFPNNPFSYPTYFIFFYLLFKEKSPLGWFSSSWAWGLSWSVVDMPSGIAFTEKKWFFFPFPSITVSCKYCFPCGGIFVPSSFASYIDFVLFKLEVLCMLAQSLWIPMGIYLLCLRNSFLEVTDHIWLLSSASFPVSIPEPWGEGEVLCRDSI